MKNIYVVLKNADFTEGRGPMLFDSVWENGDDAINYVSDQPGIYGSKQHIELNKYGFYAYANGYQIKEIPLFETYEGMEEIQKEKTRQQALAKLTKEEKEALGL